MPDHHHLQRNLVYSSACTNKIRYKKKYLSTFWLWSDISKIWLLFSWYQSFQTLYMFRYVYCQCVWTSIHTDRHTYILVLNIHIYTQRDMCTNLSQRHQDLHPPARVFAERAHPGVRKRPGFPTKNAKKKHLKLLEMETIGQISGHSWKSLDNLLEIKRETVGNKDVAAETSSSMSFPFVGLPKCGL